MRFGSSAWALTLVPSLLFAFAFPHPPPGRRENGIEQGNSVVDLDIDRTHAKATFTVPCAGCGLGPAAADESLTFQFQAFLSDHACGASNATLNGHLLAQSWDGISAHGQGSVPTLQLAPPDRPADPAAAAAHPDLLLSWQTSCLFHGPPTEQAFLLGEDVAQLLTVTVNRIGDRELPGTHGFTLSYRSFAQPELLRISPVPFPDAAQPDLSEDWRNPSGPLRIDHPATDEELSLQEHFEELRRLEQEAGALHDRIREQKKLIKSHFRHDRPSLFTEIDSCDNLSCILSAITRKAHSAFRLVYLKLRPTNDHDHFHRDGYEAMAAPNAAQFAHRPGGQADPFSIPQETYPTYTDEKNPNPKVLMAQAEPVHRHRHPQPSPLVLALEILAGILGLSGLIALLRRLCSPRRRAERQAAREERERARSYLRGARRQRFRNWFARRSARELADRDCEEKRSLVNDQECILETAMQEEIRQLRVAHEVVEGLVNAEEERISASYSRSHHSRFASMPLARVDSLPDYGSDSGLSDPPEYQTDDYDSDVVVDGFREYTPSTRSTWTPGSSIPDVSPRESGETLRSIYMRA